MSLLLCPIYQMLNLMKDRLPPLKHRIIPKPAFPQYLLHLIKIICDMLWLMGVCPNGNDLSAQFPVPLIISGWDC